MGVCLVVVSLIAACLVGCVGNVDEHTETYTDWESVTDVSSLYTYDTVKDYTEYNPSTNWTGWTNITYDTTTIANQYNYSTKEDPVADTLTPDGTAYLYSKTSSTKELGMHNYTYRYYSVTWTNDGTTYESNAMTNALYVQNLGSYLDSITFDTSDTLPTIYINGTDSTGTYTAGGIILSHSCNISQTTSDWGAWLKDGTKQIRTTYEGEYVSYITYNLNTKQVYAYDGDGNLMWSEQSDIIDMVWGGSMALGNTLVRVTVPMTAAEYMDVTKGIRTGSWTQPLWSNGYENSKVGLLIHQTASNDQYVVIAPNTDNVNNNPGRVTIYWESDGTVRCSPVSGSSSHTIGVYDTVYVELDALNETYTVTPVINFVDFGNYELLESASYTDEQYYAHSTEKGLITTMAVATVKGTVVLYGYQSTIYLGVVSTWMFQDTYQLLMRDATFNVNDYFPSLVSKDEGVMVTVGSPAVYGTSLQLGGIALRTDDKGWVYATDGSKHVIGSMDVQFNADGHLYVKFHSDKNPTYVDMGTYSDYVIEFVGDWYFDSSSLYEPITKTKTGYDWDVTKWSLDNQTFIIVFFGVLLLLGAICYWKFENIGMVDLVVIGFALVIAYIILE